MIIAQAPSNDELLANRATKARKLAAAAQRKAAKMTADMGQNRSTRQRNAIKVKADALDQIALVLAGKEPSR